MSEEPFGTDKQLADYFQGLSEQKDKIIAELRAELAAAKRYLQWALPFLPATWPCSYSDTLTSAIEQSRAYSDNLQAAIDAAKGGQQL